MKNISLGLNAVLLVAVAILYFLHFSGEITPEEVVEVPVEEMAEVVEEIDKIESNIGYIDVDSLQDNYKLHAELTKKLANREKKYEKELQTKSAAFEKKVMEFQKNAPTMTQFEGQTRQKALAEEEEQLYKMRDDFAVKFQNEQIKLNDELHVRIKTYIQEFNKEKGYNIIIGSSRVGNMVLYFDKGIDISSEVAAGLNVEYDQLKAAKNKK